MPVSDITFDSGGISLAGQLWVPAEEPENGLPAVAISGPLTGVKDQVIGYYARLLAEHGLVALAFDPRNWGESQGGPRNHEDPHGKIADLRDAISWLRAQPGIDPGRVGLVGVCAGGSYALNAAAFDPRVSAVACVAAAYNSPAAMRSQFGEEMYWSLLGQLMEAAERERESGEAAYLPAVAAEGPALMPIVEAFEYYGTDRNPSAVWENRATVASQRELLTFDALPAADFLERTALLVVHGTTDAFFPPEAAQAIYERAAGPREIDWVETTTHIDLYDQPRCVEPAAGKVAAFMHAHLGSA